jgi:hypothetical protein
MLCNRPSQNPPLLAKPTRACPSASQIPASAYVQPVKPLFHCVLRAGRNGREFGEIRGGNGIEALPYMSIAL